MACRSYWILAVSASAPSSALSSPLAWRDLSFGDRKNRRFRQRNTWQSSRSSAAPRLRLRVLSGAAWSLACPWLRCRLALSASQRRSWSPSPSSCGLVSEYPPVPVSPSLPVRGAGQVDTLPVQSRARQSRMLPSLALQILQGPTGYAEHA